MTDLVVVPKEFVRICKCGQLIYAAKLCKKCYKEAITKLNKEKIWLT